MIDQTRRTVIATGAAATAVAATSRVLAQSTGQGGAAMSFYEKGPVRIHFQEAGSGMPLLIIAGGGLNSTMAGLSGPSSPFDPIAEFKNEYRCIAADLRNANAGQSTGPLEVDRPWDAYTDDHIGVMDHLGINKFMVLGFCIGGPFIWNLLKRARRSRGRRRAGAAERLAAGDARSLLRQQHEGLGRRSWSSAGPRSRWSRSINS